MFYCIKTLVKFSNELIKLIVNLTISSIVNLILFLHVTFDILLTTEIKVYELEYTKYILDHKRRWVKIDSFIRRLDIEAAMSAYILNTEYGIGRPLDPKLRKGTLLKIPITCNNLKVSALIDTGAECSCIPVSIANRLKLTVTPYSIKVTTVSGSNQALGVATFECSYTTKSAVITVIVLPDVLTKEVLILGMDTLHLFGIYIYGLRDYEHALTNSYSTILDSPTVQLKLSSKVKEKDVEKLKHSMEHLLIKNQSLVGECSHPDAIVKLILKPGVNPTELFRQQYRIALKHRETITKQVATWLEAGKITKITSPCPYNNAIVVVPKNNGKWRVCIDFRPVNKVLKEEYIDRYMGINIKDALRSIGPYKIKTEIDVSEAYLQIRLSPESRRYTAFTWGDVQYQFEFTPFGLSPMTSIYSRLMSTIFQDMSDFLIIYVDNLLIHSTTLSEHKVHVARVLQRLNDNGLKIKPSDIKWCLDSIRTLGHIVDDLGLRIDESKMDTVKNYPPLINRDQISSFLGLTGYLCPHIRYYANIIQDLQELRNEPKQKPFVWLPKHQLAFDTLKQAICNAPRLTFPDMTRPVIIHTDASYGGIGGVIYQCKEMPAVNCLDVVDYTKIPEPSSDNIIECCSRKLTPAERNYSPYRIELTALLYCLRSFHEYVYANNLVIIFTDHKPLVALPTVAHVNHSLAMALDGILSYNFRIIHKPGVENRLADALSRIHESDISKDNALLFSTDEQKEVELFKSIAVLRKNTGSPEVLTDDNEVVSNAIARQDSVAKKKNWISKAASQASAQSPESLPLSDSLVNLSPNSSTIPLNHDRIIHLDGDSSDMVAKRLEVFHKVHDNDHPGISAMIKLIKQEERYTWKNMIQDVTKWVQQCHTCASFNVVTKKGFHPSKSITADIPWNYLMYDIKGPLPGEYTYLFVVLDIFTHYVVLDYLKDKTALTVARSLHRTMAQYGCPSIIHSDNALEFTSEIIKTMETILKIDRRFSTPLYPQSRGKVERTIGTLSTKLYKLLNGQRSNWHKHVHNIQMSHNSTPNRITNSSPFALMFGRNMFESRLFVEDNNITSQPDLILDQDRDPDYWNARLSELTNVVYPAVRERTSEVQAQQRKALDSTRRIIDPSKTFKTQNLVFIENLTRTEKAEPRYIGPFRIVGISGNSYYLYDDGKDELYPHTVKVDQLKFYAASKDDLIDGKPAEYSLEKILDHKIDSDGKDLYLIKWKDFSIKDSTWEPAEHILSNKWIEEFWEKRNASSNSSPSFSTSLSLPLDTTAHLPKGRGRPKKAPDSDVSPVVGTKKGRGRPKKS